MSLVHRLVHSIAAQPVVYDCIQHLAGLRETRRRLQPYLAELAQHSVLDVGAGTGLYVSIFPLGALYFWLDIDRDKLAGFRVHAKHIPAILSDATYLGIHSKAVDFITCIAVTHHLDDAQLQRLVQELARVAKQKVIVLDALATNRWRSRLLWHYDRGSYPRSAAHLQKFFEQHFVIEQQEHYTIQHQYVIFVATPKY